MRRSLHIAAVLTVALFVAACQGAATQGPAGTAAATGSLRPTSAATQPPQPSTGSTAATRTAIPSLPPTTVPTQGPAGGTPAPSGSAAATVAFHAAPELESAVPTQAGGLVLAVESVTGAGFADSAGNHNAGLRCRWYAGRGLRCRDQKELAAVLAALGKSRQDVSIAVSYNETKNREIEVQATRVAGVSGAQVRDATLAVLKDAASQAEGDAQRRTRHGRRQVRDRDQLPVAVPPRTPAVPVRDGRSVLRHPASLRRACGRDPGGPPLAPTLGRAP